MSTGTSSERSRFHERLARGPLLFDGAMGTLLFSRGIPQRACLDELVVTRPDLIGAIHREYLEAGADAIFPEALQSAEEFKTFAGEIKAPLLANMTEFGKSPLLSFKELSDLGYRMVIYPMSAFRVSMKASEEFLRDLKKQGTQSGWIDKMQTRQELYELLDYDPAAGNWPG